MSIHLWNVNGLSSSIHVLETESTQHDILLLTETWMLPDLQAPDIPGYTCISSSRAFMHVRARRASGGVACYIKNALANRFELWRVSLPGSILWLRSKEKYLQNEEEHHLFIGLVYIPPKGSSSEHRSADLHAYDVLQQDITDMIAHDGMAIIAGDFNARTASAAGFCQEDYTDILDTSLRPHVDTIAPLMPRQSADSHLCAFGKTLLEICEASDMCILNGRTPGDAPGNFTCCTAQGSSVVDYFLTSLYLMSAVSSMTVNEKLVESDHCSVTMQLTLQAAPQKLAEQKSRSDEAPSVTVEKINYSSSKIDLYREALAPLLWSAFSSPQPNCCLATALQACISQAALDTFGRPSKKPLQKCHQKWYDAECKNARAALRNTTDAPHVHAAKSRSYKQLLRRKRRAYEKQAQKNFCELASRNPRSFWRTYNERQRQKCTIPREQWKTSFETLYKAPEAASASTPARSAENPVNPSQPPDPASPSHSAQDDTEHPFDFLNADINQEEVKAALKRLKRNKAAGVDGVRAEFILDAADLLLNPLVQTFNQLLNEGVPPAWSVGLIHPIFKAGDPNDPGNYRGITVIVILAKLYAMVLEARASSWAEQRKCRARGQAGFRKDFRTVDQVFIMQTLVQQAKQAKRKLYCCFVDFKKAFDLVPRQTLWDVLEQRGMKGKVLASLQTMYAADKACVLTPDGPTDLFECSIGVKQGCPASPLLFGLYLDELERMLENAPGIDAPSFADILLAILLFADDIALFSYSHAGLQKQLDILAEFCSARGLSVNVKKTKALVFEHRKSITPALMYKGDVVEQVDEFKYLGMMMHGTKGLGPALQYLSKAAKRAMFGLHRRCQQLHIHDPLMRCKLFDTLVKPILCYCCEVWSVLGSKADLDEMERVELRFLKGLLGVQMHTKTLHVFAEFGRYPLHIAWQAQAAKYLRRLENMPVERVLKQASFADCRLPSKISWHIRLEKQLQDFLVPTPQDDNPSLQSFSPQSARAAFVDQIQSGTSSKAIIYRGIKEGYQCEPYIQNSNNRHLRRIMAQFRTGSHWLGIETGRHAKIDKQNRTCPMCPQRLVNPGLPEAEFDSFDSDEEGADPIEDEHHMIFDCSGYSYARDLFKDLFAQNVVTVGQFLNQPNHHRLAKFLTWARMMRMNIA